MKLKRSLDAQVKREPSIADAPRPRARRAGTSGSQGAAPRPCPVAGRRVRLPQADGLLQTPSLLPFSLLQHPVCIGSFWHK